VRLPALPATYLGTLQKTTEVQKSLRMWLKGRKKIEKHGLR